MSRTWHPPIPEFIGRWRLFARPAKCIVPLIRWRLSAGGRNMMVIDVPICESVDESSGDTFPAEVQLVISALEAGGAEPGIERRKLPRMQYRVKAYLRLFSDPT